MRLRNVALLVLATAGVSCAGRQAAGPSLRWVPDPASPGRATVEARGLDPHSVGAIATYGNDAVANRLPKVHVRPLLKVYVRPAHAGPSDAASPAPAMLGTYEGNDGVLRFRPSYPLEAGMRYEAVLDLAALPDKRRVGRGALTASYIPPPPPEAPSTVVSRVYPTVDTLPENLLKFYVRFSAPMSRGGVYRHIRLVDDASREVDLPFLELDEELWDPEMTRLTLFIDPGRIKRGVKPLEEIGPALEAGKRYTLEIGRGLVDAAGRGLGQEYRKTFIVGPPDREPPDPARWKVTPPAAKTRAPLTIEFTDPMDHALAERLIRVTAGGRMVLGDVSLDEGERRWTFVPSEPWRAGRYEVVVQATVEDLAGNNIGKPFEVDLESGGEGRPEMRAVRLPVVIR